MTTTQQAIREALEAWEVDDTKFVSGNASAGVRARKALQDLNKLTKIRRAEITAVKNARKESK